MKPVLLWVILASFMICSACAGDRTARGVHPSATEQKAVKLRSAGRIMDITDTALKLEHTTKGVVEIIDLELEIPLRKFKAGDKVVVWYVIKNKRKILKEIRPQHVLKEKEPPEHFPGGEKDYYG